MRKWKLLVVPLRKRKQRLFFTNTLQYSPVVDKRPGHLQHLAHFILFACVMKKYAHWPLEWRKQQKPKSPKTSCIQRYLSAAWRSAAGTCRGAPPAGQTWWSAAGSSPTPSLPPVENKQSQCSEVGSLPHAWRLGGRNGPKRHLGVVAKLRKLYVVQEAAGRLDDVFALLWGLLHFASQEQAAGTRHLSDKSIVTKCQVNTWWIREKHPERTYISGKLLERVKHVEAMEVYDASRQCVIMSNWQLRMSQTQVGERSLQRRSTFDSIHQIRSNYFQCEWQNKKVQVLKDTGQVWSQRQRWIERPLSGTGPLCQGPGLQTGTECELNPSCPSTSKAWCGPWSPGWTSADSLSSPSLAAETHWMMDPVHWIAGGRKSKTA